MPQEIAPEVVARVSRRLAQHAGLDLPAWVVEARTAQRVAATGIAPAEYAELIHTARGAAELDELTEAVRVGETRLFRHRSQIQALVDVVAPALRARGKKAIRVWSAGCAGGEEPFTLAAVLAHALPGVVISIVGSDVSADALAMARQARYPASAWNDIPEAWRDAFVQDGDAVSVAPAIASLVKFERANLASVSDPTPRGCDLVWCRNVLIYFTPAARKQVVDRLVGALVPGGFLFVGYSESLRGIAELEAHRAGDAVYYVRQLQPAYEAYRMTPPAGIPKVTTGEHVVIARSSAEISAPIPVARAPLREDVADRETTLVLRGTPTARDVTSELMTRLASPGLMRLIVDLDAAELIEDELAPVLRRARAAARAAHVALILRATRTGSKRWLTRHQLDDEEAR